MLRAQGTDPRGVARWRSGRGSSAWALVLLGLVVSGLLMYRTLALASGGAADGIDLCSTVFGSSCDGTLERPSALVLGLPWAGWGLVFYAVLLTLLVLSVAPRAAFSPAAPLAAALLSSAGAMVGLAFTGAMLLASLPVCPLCLLVHVVTLTLVPVMWIRCALTPREALRRVGSGVGFVVGAPGQRGRVSGAKVVGLVCALLVALVVYQRIDIEWRLRSLAAQPDTDLDVALRRWRAQPEVALPVRPDDPRLGASNAPAQVVVFSSLQCPGCAQALEFFVRLQGKLGSRFSVVFKHYPLGKVCNPYLEGDPHPKACAAAHAAEAARMQGQFWPFHDVAQTGDLRQAPAFFKEASRALGLDAGRFASDSTSEMAALRVQADIQLGHRLGVDATPFIFLNARRVDEDRFDVIEYLIERASDQQSVP